MKMIAMRIKNRFHIKKGQVYISFVLAAAIILTMALAGCAAIQAEPAQATEPEPLTPVEVTLISAREIKRVMTYAGKAAPGQTISVVGKITGKVKEVYFDVGDAVNQGDVLFRLDEQDILDQLKQLEAQLHQSNQAVITAENGLNSVTGGQFQSQVVQQETAIASYGKQIETAQIAIQNAELAISNAQLALNSAETSYESTLALYDEDIITKSELDRAELAYNQSKSALEQARNALSQATVNHEQLVQARSKAQQSLSLTRGQIVEDSKRQAELAIEQTKAARGVVEVQIENAKKTIEDTAVTCPMSGIINTRGVKVDEYASPQLPAFTIVNTETVNVEVNVSETLINTLYEGLVVEVYINSVRQDAFSGTIVTISPTADQTNTFPVKIEIENRGLEIKPGMFAEVHFSKEHSENTVVVPRNTVISNVDTDYVYVVRGNAAYRAPVVLGIDNGEEIEILSGVSPGDRVITKGHTFVSDGEVVNVVAETD